ADVPGQSFADLDGGRLRCMAQQVVSGDDQPGCAEAALDRARLDERLLHRMQGMAVGDPFDRDDVAALRLPAEHNARAHQGPIHINGARSALALLARVLRPVKAQPLSEDVEQAFTLPNLISADPLPVDGERDLHATDFRRYSSQAQANVRRASTASACRR